MLSTITLLYCWCQSDTDSSHKLAVILTQFSAFFLVGLYFIVVRFYWDSADLEGLTSNFEFVVTSCL